MGGGGWEAVGLGRWSDPQKRAGDASVLSMVAEVLQWRLGNKGDYNW